MFLQYKPTWMLEAIYQLTPQQLHAQGIRAILTDLDNTLIAWNHPEGTPELIEWIKTMEAADIPVVVVSNNNEERVKKALERLELSYVARALKPFARGMNQAIDQLGLTKEEVVMVGDQLMTDIRAANRAGVRSILVQPIVKTDSWKTKFNRMIEKRVMAYLKAHHQEMKWSKKLC